MLLTDNALPLTLTYARHDSLGVYVRFGDGKIASYTTYGWGGVYYQPNAFVGGGPGITGPRPSPRRNTRSVSRSGVARSLHSVRSVSGTLPA